MHLLIITLEARGTNYFNDYVATLLATLLDFLDMLISELLNEQEVMRVLSYQVKSLLSR